MPAVRSRVLSVEVEVTSDVRHVMVEAAGNVRPRMAGRTNAVVCVMAAVIEGH